MKLVWDQTGEKLYEAGVEKGVVYPQDTEGNYPKGAAWNGLINVSENPSGAEPSPLYADNIKYLELMSTEEFSCGIEAYMYPNEFAECDGSAELVPGVTIGQQKRKPFGLSYRTILGNDIDNNDYGYKLHLVYGLKASPSEKSYGTVNDNPEAATFSWDCSSTPVAIAGFKPTSTIVLDSTKVAADKMTAIENILYGSEDTEPRLPLPDELATILKDSE